MAPGEEQIRRIRQFFRELRREKYKPFLKEAPVRRSPYPVEPGTMHSIQFRVVVLQAPLT
jgi:hypothetical protein